MENIKGKNYNLHLINTDKFKTINLSVNFMRENSAEDELYRDLLIRVLPLATNRYHDLDDLCRARMEIYDPSIKFGNVVSGLDRIIYFEGSFVNESYTEKGMNEKNLKFLFDYFWNPYVDENRFNKEIFEICKHEYIESLKSIKNNPDRYAKELIWENMDIYPFHDNTISELIEFASKVTEKDLYNYYKSMFSSDSLEIFVAGNFDNEEIASIISRIVTGDFKEGRKARVIRQNAPLECKEVSETTENKQSKLVLGLKYCNLTDFEKKYVSLVYNNILGGGWNSRLNKVVREENSMCYYIYATRQITCGLSFIYSGIDKNNKDKVVSLIKTEMQNMKDGNISLDELETVKKIYKNALIDIEDNLGAIVDNAVALVVTDTDEIEERKVNIDKVSISDIKALAEKVYIDTICMLEGGAA